MAAAKQMLRREIYKDKLEFRVIWNWDTFLEAKCKIVWHNFMLRHHVLFFSSIFYLLNHLHWTEDSNQP